MQQIAKAEFVRGTRSRCIVEQMRRVPHGPPTWNELRGVRDHELAPGRRCFANRSRTARPGANPMRAEVDAFLMAFLEIGGERLPQATLEPVVKQVCTMLGWRRYVGKAREIARRIQPSQMKKRGATNTTERQGIEAWRLAMRKKCGDLQDELDADRGEFAN